jgi:phosphoribosylaminoimidazole-succinocarboxamide synthase
MDAAGFNTHYISHDVDAATMQVFPLSIEELDVSYGVFANQGRIIGVEIIDRRVVTEKLIRRIEAGEIDRTSVERLLVGELGLVPGARLSPPFIECTTKYRDADVYVSDKQAANLAKLSLKHLAQVYEDSRKASDFLSNFFRSHGFDRKDGKCEGAWTTSGFMFADSISPDEMRLIGPDGKSHDKDPVREWFELNHPDWYASVLAAKKKFPNDKSQWPGYPNKMPPQKIIQEVVGRYEAVAVAINAI